MPALPLPGSLLAALGNSCRQLDTAPVPVDILSPARARPCTCARPSRAQLFPQAQLHGRAVRGLRLRHQAVRHASHSPPLPATPASGGGGGGRARASVRSQCDRRKTLRASPVRSHLATARAALVCSHYYGAPGASVSCRWTVAATRLCAPTSCPTWCVSTRTAAFQVSCGRATRTRTARGVAATPSQAGARSCSTLWPRSTKVLSYTTQALQIGKTSACHACLRVIIILWHSVYVRSNRVH